MKDTLWLKTWKEKSKEGKKNNNEIKKGAELKWNEISK